MIPEVLGRLIGRHRYGRESYFSDQLKDKYENLSAYFNLCSLSSLRSAVSSGRQIRCCDDLVFAARRGLSFGVSASLSTRSRVRTT